MTDQVDPQRASYSRGTKVSLTHPAQRTACADVPKSTGQATSPAMLVREMRFSAACERPLRPASLDDPDSVTPASVTQQDRQLYVRASDAARTEPRPGATEHSGRDQEPSNGNKAGEGEASPKTDMCSRAFCPRCIDYRRIHLWSYMADYPGRAFRKSCSESDHNAPG